MWNKQYLSLTVILLKSLRASSDYLLCYTRICYITLRTDACYLSLRVTGMLRLLRRKSFKFVNCSFIITIIHHHDVSLLIINTILIVSNFINYPVPNKKHKVVLRYSLWVYTQNSSFIYWYVSFPHFSDLQQTGHQQCKLLGLYLRTT